MADVQWEQRTVAVPDLTIACYEAGRGALVLVLHGGPGHDHRFMRTLAAPLTQHFQCVLYDQRGTGHSRLAHTDPFTLHIDRFVSDIEALRVHFGTAQLTLVGWSWGATLALMYSLAHPSHVERLAMISPGPIPFEMLEVYQANLLRPLTISEREQVSDLQIRSATALQTGDIAQYNALFQRRMEIMFRVWFYDPNLAQQYLATFVQAINPYRIAQMEPYIYGSLGEFSGWQNMDQLTMPTLIMYGYQDFEPITQAYTLREWMPQAELRWLTSAGTGRGLSNRCSSTQSSKHFCVVTCNAGEQLAGNDALLRGKNSRFRP